MYEKILIGYQDTERGHEAMVLGVALAKACRAVMRVATVEGKSAPALARLADEEGADLIVLGATHRHGLGRIVPGTTVEGLLAVSSCAVAVAPVGFGSVEAAQGWRPLGGEGEDSGMRVIGVGFDGSPAAREALAAAVALALSNGAALKVFTVAHRYGQMSAEEAAAVAPTLVQGVEARRQMLEKAVAELPAETRALPVLLRGLPATELNSASTTGIDLLVVGCRRGGSLRRHLYGSTTSALLAGIKCPLLVLPSGVAAPGSGSDSVVSDLAAV